MAQLTFGGPQTQEMDIFTDTTADDTTADNNVVYDAGMFTITNPLEGADYSQAEEYYYGDTYVAEDGLRYNENGERVYKYQPAGEGGSGKYGGTDFGANDESEIYGDVGFYTEAEIRELWNSGEMGNTTDQFDSFEDYLSYIQAVDEFRANPEYQATYDRREEISRIGLENGLSPEEIQAQIDAEIGEAIAGYEAEWQGIREEYGVDDIIRTENGDVYKWNGYAYTKTHEVNTAGELMKAVVISGISMALGGPLTAALQGAGMGAAAASALSAGIMSSATQLIATGEIDPAQALMSAILAGAGEYIKDPTVLDGIAGDIATAANEYTGKIDDFINSTVGNEFLQTAISAGLKDAAIQAITTGDVNFQQVLTSGGTAAAMKYLKQFFGENMTEESNEEFEAWLDEQEAMDAQYPNNDPFGEWVEMDDGTVLYNSEGDYYYADGTKATLEAIGVNPVTPASSYDGTVESGRRYYVDGAGNIYTNDDVMYDNEGNIIVKSTNVRVSDLAVVNGELYDAENRVLYDANGNVIAKYDETIKNWVDGEGNFNATTEAYMNEMIGTKTQEFGGQKTLDEYLAGVKESTGSVSGSDAVDYLIGTTDGVDQNNYWEMSTGDQEQMMRLYGIDPTSETAKIDLARALAGDGYAVNTNGNQIVLDFNEVVKPGVYGVDGVDPVNTDISGNVLDRSETTKNTVLSQPESGPLAEQQTEDQPVEKQDVEEQEPEEVTPDTQEVTSTEVKDATTVEPTTTGDGATDDTGGSLGGATGENIPQGVDPVLMAQLQDAIRRGDNEAANEIIKQIQAQQQEQQQSEQDQEQVVDDSEGTDYSAEEPQKETDVSEGDDTEEQVVVGGQTDAEDQVEDGAESENGETKESSGTDSDVTETSGDEEDDSAGSNRDMTFGGSEEVPGASDEEEEGAEDDEEVVPGDPDAETPGPDPGPGGPVTIINNYGGGGGMLTGPKPVNIRDFKPFMTGLSEGKAVVQETYTPPQKDYVADLDAIIKRSMFRKLG